MGTRLLATNEVKDRGKYSHAGLHRAIKGGLMVPPIPGDEFSRRYVESEVDAVINARIAGASPDAIRDLVARLVNERASRAAAAGIDPANCNADHATVVPVRKRNAKHARARR